MPLFGSLDQSNNSPISSPAMVNQAPTATNANNMYGNTTAGAFITNQTVGIFSVSDAEKNYGTANGVLTASVNVSGNSTSSYVPGDVVKVSGGTGQAAQVVVKTTKVGTVAANAASGNGYANNDTVTVGGGSVFTVTTGAANSSIASLALTTNGSFSVNPQLADVVLTTLTGNGAGGKATLTMKVETIELVSPGFYTADPSSPASTTGGSGGGLTLDITTGAVKGENARVAHTGWVVRREGSGGRAGRVHYETLVAGTPSSNGSSDDSILPQ